MAAALWAASALGATAAIHAQEMVFGGQANFAAGATANLTEPRTISPFFRLGLGPELAIFADTAELRVSGTLERSFGGTDEEFVRGSLDTLQLRLFPLDWLTVDLGLQRSVPGAAILLSPVNYLMPIAFDTGDGALPSTAGTAAMAGATAFLGSGYVAVNFSPAPPVLNLPTIDPSVLDGVALFSSITDADVGGTLTRASLSLDETQVLPEPWRRVSFDIEAGVPIGPFDLTAMYYHGIDRFPTVEGVLDTNSSPAGEFDLVIAPVESVIDAFGLSAQTALGPAMFWLDGSWVLGRTFGTLDPVSTPTPGVYQLDTLVAPHVEVVAGGLVQVFRPSLLIAAEYRHGFIGSDEAGAVRSDIVRLDFPGTALLSLTADFWGGLVSATAAGVVLIPDRSAVLLGSVELAPSSELSVFVQAPVILASGSSLLGGLRDRLSLTAGLTYRF